MPAGGKEGEAAGWESHLRLDIDRVRGVVHRAITLKGTTRRTPASQSDGSFWQCLMQAPEATPYPRCYSDNRGYTLDGTARRPPEAANGCRPLRGGRTAASSSLAAWEQALLICGLMPWTPLRRKRAYRSRIANKEANRGPGTTDVFHPEELPPVCWLGLRRVRPGETSLREILIFIIEQWRCIRPPSERYLCTTRIRCDVVAELSTERAPP